MDVWRGFSAFARFYMRMTMAHVLTYVVIGGFSYMLIMRHCWANFPADLSLRDITGSHVQFWLWPAQFIRSLVLAAVFYPLRETLLRKGRFGGLLVAGIMVGIGCLAGFNGLIENLIFYRNVSLYLYYVHIPEILAQTLAFGYFLVWLEKAAEQRGLQTIPSLAVTDKLSPV